MSLFDISTVVQNQNLPESKTIVRLTNSWYQSSNGAYVKKTEIRPLRKQCTGFQPLSEEVDCVGVSEAICKIVNLDSCIDGVYELIVRYERNWDYYGCVDDVEFILVPHKQE